MASEDDFEFLDPLDVGVGGGADVAEGARPGVEGVGGSLRERAIVAKDWGVCARLARQGGVVGAGACAW